MDRRKLLLGFLPFLAKGDTMPANDPVAVLHQRFEDLENFLHMQLGLNPLMQLQQNPGQSVSPTSQNPRPQCTVYINTGTVTVPSTTLTPIPFDFNEYDPLGMHPISGTKFYAPVAGLYLAMCALGYFGVPGATDNANLSIYKNGNLTGSVAAVNSQVNRIILVSRILFLEAADYIEFYAFQRNAGALAVFNVSNTGGSINTWAALAQLS